MAGFFSSGSCQCQTSLFYLVSEIYELDTNGLGKLFTFLRQETKLGLAGGGGVAAAQRVPLHRCF